MTKELIFNSQFITFMDPRKKSDYCNSPITATKKNENTFYCNILNKNIENRNFKTFWNDDFFQEIGFKLSKETIYKYKDKQYDILVNIFWTVLDKHSNIKDKNN